VRRLRAYLVIAAILLTAGGAQAGDAGQESPFIVGAGARALGMGGGFVSVADDASSVYYNPAGLPRLEYQELSAMHMSLMEGTMYDYAAWAYPTPSLGGFGLAFMRLGTDDIIRREGFVETGTFGYSYSQFLVSYGRRLRGHLSAGLTLKMLYQSLDIYSDWGVGLDFGMIAEPVKHLSIGLTVRDMIPATLELNTAEETLPITVVAGLALHDLALTDRIGGTVSIDLEKTENRDVRVHTGAEMVFDRAYVLRAGYDRDNLSFGAGFQHDRFKFDYAYKVLDYIDDSHRFSISYQIGTSVSEQTRIDEMEEERRGSELLAHERQRQLLANKDKADEFYHQYRLDSALTYYQRALAFDEDNQEIIGTIAAIENVRRIQRDQEQLLRERQYEFGVMIQTYLDQAELFYAKAYYPAALDMLQLVFEIDPNHFAARRLKDDIDDAMQESVAASLKVGSEAVMQGDQVRAIEAYQHVLYLDPDNAEAIKGKQDVAINLDIARHLNVGIDLFKAGRYAEARKQFQLVLSANRTEPVAREYMDRIEAALAHPPTLEKIQRDSDIWQLYLDGLRHMRNQDYQKAIDVWEQVLDAYPGNENTLNNIEQARLRLMSQSEE